MKADFNHTDHSNSRDVTQPVYVLAAVAHLPLFAKHNL